MEVEGMGVEKGRDRRKKIEGRGEEEREARDERERGERLTLPKIAAVPQATLMLPFHANGGEGEWERGAVGVEK